VGDGRGGAGGRRAPDAAREAATVLALTVLLMAAAVALPVLAAVALMAL
jgi:hypothetical protein